MMFGLGFRALDTGRPDTNPGGVCCLLCEEDEMTAVSLTQCISSTEAVPATDQKPNMSSLRDVEEGME